MARPRTPAAKAKVSGAAAKNPGRFEGRTAPKRTRPVGEPFARMTVEQQEAWASFRAELPWLTSAHRALLQVACVLRARLEADSDLGVNQLQTYSSVLSKLAATPVDESKIRAGDDEEVDPTDAYFGATAH